jgi:dolichol-phosphate mannosyltransferase
VIWIVMPTYNERANVETIVPAIRAVLPEATILVVDDSSPDGTGDLADELAAADDHVKVLHRTKKDGLARAYCAGFDAALAAGATRVIQMDADWSHPPALLPTLMARLDGGADLAIGSRYVRGGGTQGWPLKRRFISRCGNLFAQIVLTLPYPDMTGAYKAWRAETLRAVDPGSIDVSGYVFMIELVERAHLLGARIAQVPFVFVERVEGVSKMSGGIFFEAFRHVIRLRLDRIRGRSRRTRPAA